MSGNLIDAAITFNDQVNDGKSPGEDALNTGIKTSAKAGLSWLYTKTGMEIGNKIGQNFGAQGQAACTLGGAAIGMLLDVLTTDQIVDGINDFLYDVTENYEDSLIFQ